MAIPLDPATERSGCPSAPHRSDTNHSERARRTWYVTDNTASAGDWRDRSDADKRALPEEVGDGDTAHLCVDDDFLGIPLTGD